ncbi:conserved hypothetical protein [Leishmania braziliensis MHOM/BR/75/M2904]|uniref:Uncharacterized protein n=2 Tax=Leishmania braziliensis TaxID=5660 RepID=A4HKA2_LEIBR|nr:conserved hypothetical protein [Leishmania braziliensis MHOM/BR/75/M2904]CAJ2478511.1 unnamed protein product [Leishmania braziliensis]CAM42925.1 conserved hypothetical protein [Leishmania braziliensis MHOM/BR/75/M2904]SYZ68634.1 hypothetical_protein [Leishmania braziliensis MHOM/BR/75/M2904]
MDASAQHHSLELDQVTCPHYYHCVLHDVPFHLPVREIAARVVPNKDSDLVQRLAGAGCRIVPHQLHMYKEPLEKKFGYVSFFIRQELHSTTDADYVHRLVCEWIAVDLASQLATTQCKVQLSQPPECHSSESFLNTFRRRCPLLDPKLVSDPMKLETFILTRVRFAQHRGNASINELNAMHCDSAKVATSVDRRGTETGSSMNGGLTGTESETDSGVHSATRTRDEHVWKCVGTFSIAALSSKEIVWLKKQIPSFSPLLITNGDDNTTHCDEVKLAQFFEASLTPLFTVEKVKREAGVATVSSET